MDDPTARFDILRDVLPFAGTILVAVISGVFLRKGQKDTAELEEDRVEIERERLANEERTRIMEAQRGEVDRVNAARDADEQRHARQLAAIREDFTRRLREQYERCEASTRRMHDDLLSLASAFRSEVDQAAAKDAGHRGETHLRFDHDTDDVDGQP